MALTSCATINQTYNSQGTCDPPIAGTGTYYLGNLDIITGLTVSSARTVTAIGMSAGTKLYEYLPWEFRGVADVDGQTSEFGSKSYNGKITLELLGLTTEAVMRAQKIEKSKMFVVVKGNSGKYWMWGVSENEVATPSLAAGVKCLNSKYQMGTKRDDFTGISLELSWNASSPPIEVDPSILPAIVVAA